MKPTMTVAAVSVALLMTGCATSSPAAPASTPDAALQSVGEAWPDLPRGVLASGSFQGAARGDVEIVNNGDGRLTIRVEAVGYTVATNDLIDEVAARFGMTADDIRYLNPLHGPKLRVNETIILNGAAR